jgi:Ca2+-transporting ATPase
MVKNTANENTPLQERLVGVSKFLGLSALFVCLIVIAAGLLNNFSFLEMFSSATAIAVAAIPEGMAVAVTVILALGMKETVKKKALTRKLLAAETLGSIDIICSDKTGTLTEGVMRLEKIVSLSNSFELNKLLAGQELNKLSDFLSSLKIGLLCNNAVLGSNGHKDLGSALEVAFLKAAANFQINNKQYLKDSPRLAELPFSSEKKFMISLHQEGKQFVLYEKGAGEIILDKCSFIQENGEIREITNNDIKKIKTDYEKMTTTGLRVIALAFRSFDKLPFEITDEINDWSVIDQDLTFVSLAAFKDPLRPESKNTISLCQQAGIRPIIITGDHPGTAFAIASELKISFSFAEVITGPDLDKLSDKKLRELVKNFSVYARVSPEHKIRIVKALKHNGRIVAMTGDGLNDSPALKAADIGICLGSGTEVAKETADIVLLDDNFSVIVDAIRQGRIIFDNIRKSITYLVSDSFSEIVLILGSILFHAPLALLPTQILWINILNDGLPNFSLAFEKGDDSVMKRQPLSREEPIFNKEMKAIVLGVGLIRDILIFTLFFYFFKNLEILDWSVTYLRTVFFAMLIFKSLTGIFSIRSLNLPIHKIPQFHNRYLFLAIFIGLLLMFAAVYLPFLNNILKTTPLQINAWLIIIAVAIINIIMIEVVKAYFIKKEKRRN